MATLIIAPLCYDTAAAAVAVAESFTNQLCNIGYAGAILRD